MLNYCKKCYFVKVHESWFNYSFSLVDLFLFKVCFHIKSAERSPFVIKKSIHTIENSLENNIEDVYAGFSKNIRTGISKAEKAGIISCFNNNISDFVKFYNSFAIQKSIPLTSKRRLIELGENLRIGFAYHDGKILAAHSYLIDVENETSVILWGGSARLGKGSEGKLAGWANQFLYFKSMEYFKSRGIKFYDWGGYNVNTKDEHLQGINNFKRQYGGNIIACYNYFSVGYSMLHIIAKFFGFLGKGY